MLPGDSARTNLFDKQKRGNLSTTPFKRITTIKSVIRQSWEPPTDKPKKRKLLNPFPNMFPKILFYCVSTYQLYQSTNLLSSLSSYDCLKFNLTNYILTKCLTIVTTIVKPDAVNIIKHTPQKAKITCWNKSICLTS